VRSRRRDFQRALRQRLADDVRKVRRVVDLDGSRRRRTRAGQRAGTQRVDLLVLEDFGMKKLGATAAEDLLEVFVRRHETASTLITTNRPTQDWGVFLGDVPAATAILDRFLAHAEIVQMTGKSFRLRGRTTADRDT
jgi:DNA replication protein DnaC